MGAKLDLRGQKFGRLTVLEEAGRRNGAVLWKCQCDCGNITEVRTGHLRRGAIVSCGCYNREVITTHGRSKSRLHHTWQCMVDRCTNPNSQEADGYINRGIKVCDEWLNSFEAFAEWAEANGFREDAKRGDNTLDRIDNNGNYEPSNCRWTDMKVQGRNRRNNVVIECDGESHCLSEWAEILGEPYAKLASRHRRGWSPYQILYGRKMVISKDTCRNRASNRLLTYKGETHCAIEWAEILGINVNTIRGRLHRGWSDERTLGTPT